MHLCPVTGKAFVYHYENKKTVKKYDIQDIQIPEKYRRFVELRGHFLHAYTDEFNFSDIFETRVYNLLEEFPAWEEVTKYEFEDDYWSEEDHNTFKEALKWFSEQPYTFNASWSY